MPHMVGKKAPSPPKRPTEEDIKAALMKFDSNGDHRLSKEELKKAFSNLGALVPGFRSWRGMKLADDDGDGFVDENELPKLIKYVSSLGYAIKA
uniref:Calmodulin-like protein 39 n=1 Tax=Carica papaya TaxID=3649 RepID=A0A3Q8UB61_CARPA|nr:calmodulin-like protein 39 [Carica papaya]